ncbi:MAG: hypothetical protein PHO31_01115 [Candidatus Pacebacteria bacterium]|nr:hypothetical protein [Candidatus Paceibacterota bacterium]
MNINYELILEFIKIIIWPGLISIFIFKFKNEIKGLINRIVSAEFPGGIKVNLPLEQKTPDKNIPEEIKDSIEIKKEFSDKELNDLQRQINVLLSQINTLRTALIFERIYQTIFGSQINLLEELRLKGTNGVFYEDIAAYYQQIRIKWPDLNSYPLENYLNYLINSGLVEVFFDNEKKKCRITPLGIDFLEYIKKLNYSKEKVF